MSNQLVSMCVMHLCFYNGDKEPLRSLYLLFLFAIDLDIPAQLYARS